MCPMVAVESAELRASHQGQPNMAHPVYTSHSFRYNRADGSQSGRNRNRCPDDPHRHPRLRRLYPLEGQAKVVREGHGRYHLPSPKDFRCHW